MVSVVVTALRLTTFGLLASHTGASGRLLASCKDYDWQDADGDTCSDYAREKWCAAKWAQKYSTPSLVGRQSTAAEACCACGGGRRSGEGDYGSDYIAPSFQVSHHVEEKQGEALEDETEAAARRANEADLVAQEAEAKGREAALRQQKAAQTEAAHRAAEMAAEQAEINGQEATAREERAQHDAAAKREAAERDAKEAGAREAAERAERDALSIAAAGEAVAREDGQPKAATVQKANVEEIAPSVTSHAKQAASEATAKPPAEVVGAKEDAEVVGAKEVEQAARRSLEEKVARQVAEMNANSAERRAKEAESERDQEKRMRLDLQVQVSAQLRRANGLVEEVAHAQDEATRLRNATRASNDAREIAEDEATKAKKKSEEFGSENKELRVRTAGLEQADAADRNAATLAQAAAANATSAMRATEARLKLAEAERDHEKEVNKAIEGISNSAQAAAVVEKFAATNATTALTLAKKQIDTVEAERDQARAAEASTEREALKVADSRNRTEQHVGALRKLLVKAEEKLHDSEVRRKAAVDAALEAEGRRAKSGKKRKQTE